MFSWSRPPSNAIGRPDNNNNLNTANLITTSQVKNRYSRQQHIDSYVNDALLKPSTRLIKRDEIFETVFQTKNQNVLILRVHIPLSSQSSSSAAASSESMVVLEPPILSLIGVRATHPWIDSTTMQVINIKAISSVDSWNACGFLLGKVVKEVVQHFQLNPPTVLVILDPMIQKIQPSSEDGNISSHGEKTSSSYDTKAVHKIPLPPTYEQFIRSFHSKSSDPKKTDDILSIYMPSTTVPDYYPELDALTKEELERLDTDMKSLLEFLQVVPLVQTTLCQKSSMEEETKKDAQRNLNQQEEVSQLFKDVSTLQQTILDKICIHEMLLQNMKQMTQPKDINDVIQQLQRAKRASFMESETLTKNLSEFPNELEAFIDIRTTHHVRAAKIERLQHNSLHY